MARNTNIDSARIAVESAALNETVVKTSIEIVKRKPGRPKAGADEITQTQGSVQISLKKFPAEWQYKIKKYTPTALTDYILLAVREKMAKDGIL